MHWKRSRLWILVKKKAAQEDMNKSTMLTKERAARWKWNVDRNYSAYTPQKAMMGATEWRVYTS